MNTNHLPNDLPAEESSCGQQNIQQLVQEAYQPELPDPAFVRRVEESLYEVAREFARRQTLSPEQVTRLSGFRRRMAWVMAAAATVAALSLIWQVRHHPVSAPSARIRLDPSY